MLALIRRKIFEPLYALNTGSKKLAYLKILERTQYLSIDELLEIQWRRFKAIIDYIYDCNDFYRQRFFRSGLKPSDFKQRSDVMKIPILTKKEVRYNWKKMISDGYNVDNLLKFKTGGSTGKALEFFISEECSEQRNACALRHDKWTEWNIGEPIGAAWGNPELPKSMKEKFRSWLMNPTIFFDTMKVTNDSVRNFAKEWEKIRPTLLFGHAHSIFILSQYVKKLSIKTIRPRGIITSSMMLLPHERKSIEDIFKTKVTNRYGCEEVSLIASECEQHEGMHMNIEHLFIEIIKEDGKYALPGEPGNIIVTDLMDKAMPFIRYQVEDIGILSENVCSCGRGMPLLEKVSGRVADFLVTEDGTKVAGISLIENTLTKIQGIDQMQIIQESQNHIILNIVKGNSDTSSIKIELLKYFQNLFGFNTQIEIRMVDDIKPEKSGKFRFSICKF